MLATFASVGARSFDVTLTDIEGEKISFQINRSLAELRRTIVSVNTAELHLI